MKLKIAFLRHDLSKLGEKCLRAIVWKLPKTVVMWCAYRVLAHATTGEYSAENANDLNAMDAMKRWETA